MQLLNDFSTAIRRSVTSVCAQTLSKQFQDSHGLTASVIVVTRNRATYLDISLAFWERQVFPPAHWQLIVIDDFPLDGTHEVLSKYERRGRLNLVGHRTRTYQGSVAARNLALQMAHGHVVIFVHDNYLVAPDFLMSHLMAHVGTANLVLGSSHWRFHTHLFSHLDPPPQGILASPVYTPEELIDNPQWIKHLAYEGNDDLSASLSVARGKVQNPLGWAYSTTANSSVLRDQLIDAGCFDESFYDWGLADEDLAYRLHLRGVSLYYQSSASVFQQVYPDETIQSSHVGYNLHHFFCKHPILNEKEVSTVLLRKYFA